MNAGKLVIIGDSAFAEIAYEYFDADSEYEVVGFAVERKFLRSARFKGLPLVALEEITDYFPPDSHSVYVAVTYTQLNRLRERLLVKAKGLGYDLASYISSRAFLWRNVVLGEHCFIFEDNTVQPFVTIEDNTILWSGNHIGHHSRIRKNCFISSHVVVAGVCDIGENSFLGVNATVANNITVGRDTWIGPNTAVMKDVAPGTLFKTPHTEPAKISALKLFKIEE